MVFHTGMIHWRGWRPVDHVPAGEIGKLVDKLHPSEGLQLEIFCEQVFFHLR